MTKESLKEYFISSMRKLTLFGLLEIKGSISFLTHYLVPSGVRYPSVEKGLCIYSLLDVHVGKGGNLGVDEH